LLGQQRLFSLKSSRIKIGVDFFQFYAFQRFFLKIKRKIAIILESTPHHQHGKATRRHFHPNLVLKLINRKERGHFEKIASRIMKLEYNLNMQFVDSGEPLLSFDQIM
jgi:hypothetical protein